MSPTVYRARRMSVLLGVFALALCVLVMTGNRPGAALLAILTLITAVAIFTFAERTAA